MDPEAISSAGRDFGGIVRRRAVAVLQAASADDCRRILHFAGRHSLRVAPRGQGHSSFGQALVDGGVVLDLGALDRVEMAGPDEVLAEAGARWSTVAAVALRSGRLPPVLPDYLELSVGGMLSVGGLTGTSFRCGAAVDHVSRLDVVTGAGEFLSCSPLVRPKLFDAVLAGVGQCAVIVRAVFRVVPVSPAVRVWRLPYRHPAALTADLRRLVDDERFEYLLGVVKRREGGSWDCSIEAVDDGSESPDTILAGLRCETTGCQWALQTRVEWVWRVAERVAMLQAAGLWDRPHPWLDVVVPDGTVDAFLPEILASPSAGGLDPLRVLVYPLRPKRCRRPLLRLPDGDKAFLIDVMATAADASGAAAMTASNRVLYERNRLGGGTMYPIGAVPLTGDDWRQHYGPEWGTLRAAKARFDPGGVLTPGPGIFPADPSDRGH